MAPVVQVNRSKRQRKHGFFRKFLRNWFTVNPWILGAYRDHIDYASFLPERDNNKKITEAEKDQVLRDHGKEILAALKGTPRKENPSKKAFLHYLGKTAVYLLSLSSGFILSGMVMSHLPLAAGSLARELTAWAFFTCSYWAHIVIFRKSVPAVAEKLLYVGNEEDGSNTGWHFLKKFDLKVHRHLVDRTVLTEYYNPGDNSYESDPKNNTFGGWEKVIGIILLCSITVVAAIGSSLSVTKAIPAMESMQLLSLMQLGSTFLPIGYILAVSSFLCSLGLLLNTVIKLLKDQNKSQAVTKLFYWGDTQATLGISPMRKYCTNALTIVVMLVLAGLVGLGMYGSSRVEAEDFVGLVGKSLEGMQYMATMGTLLGVALLAKLVFTVKATVNLLLLAGRSLNVAGTWVWSGLTSLFSRPQPKPLTDLDFKVCSNHSSDHHAWYDNAAVAVNAMSQPAKTTQAPSHDKPDSDPGLDPDTDPSEEIPAEGSPFIDGDFWTLTYVWCTGLGATIRSAAAAFNEVEAYVRPPNPTDESDKISAKL